MASFFTFTLLKRKIAASPCYLYFVSQHALVKWSPWLSSWLSALMNLQRLSVLTLELLVQYFKKKSILKQSPVSNLHFNCSFHYPPQHSHTVPFSGIKYPHDGFWAPCLFWMLNLALLWCLLRRGSVRISCSCTTIPFLLVFVFRLHGIWIKA